MEATYQWLQTNEGNCLIALGTGGGKSLIIAKFCEDAMQWKNQHVLICTHSKELVVQDRNELHNLCPEIHAGIYCAGLGKKQIRNVTFASIQSICKIKQTPFVDLLIVDEAQAVNDSKDTSMYASFIARLRIANPDIRVVGLSATIFRMGSGLLHEGNDRLFHGVSYEVPIKKLVDDGYLVPLVSKHSKIQGNRANIGISQGDFKIQEAETEFNRQALTEAALDEVMKYGADRKSWLFFCITVKHAEHVRDALRARGIDAECVSDKTPTGERDRMLVDYKAGRFRALCNVNIAAIGFNATCVDLIAMLRPTLSPGWHVQALGRGSRRHEGKENCLILDFAGNLEALGPVTHVIPPVRGKRPSKDEYAGRICPKCESVSARGATECIDCGFLFPVMHRKVKHSRVASNIDAMSNEPVVSAAPVWLNVQSVHYEIHVKANSPNSLKVLYRTEAQWILTWLAFASPKPYARQKAAEWWRARSGQTPVPETAEAALGRINELAAFKTKRIKVQKEGKYFNVLAVDLERTESKIITQTGNMGQSAVQAC